MRRDQKGHKFEQAYTVHAPTGVGRARESTVHIRISYSVKRMIVEPLQFLCLQTEYTSAVLPSSPAEDRSSDSLLVSKRGRKRRDPERISQMFAEEKRKRALWYRQQQHQYIQDQQRQEEEDNQRMLDDILSSLQIPITVSPPTVPPSPAPSSNREGGYGQYRKNIENCPFSPPPPRKRRRRTKTNTMRMMLANIKL